MTLIALMMLAADPLAEPMPEVVLLDFTASYCGPCQEMVPSIQRMERDGFPVRKVDITQHPQISRRFNVEKIPTFILLVDGQEKKRFVGKRSEDELRRVMLEARDTLRAEREPPAPEPAPEVAADEQRPGGLRGIFQRIREGFGGRSRSAGFQHPTFRAQSPDSQPSGEAGEAAMAATVRVRVRKEDGKEDVGSGSIVHSTDESSVILTCAHLFRGMGRNPDIEVEVFHDGRTLKYKGEIVTGDHELELAILQISNSSALPTVKVAPVSVDVRAEDGAFSIGCDHGRDPSHLAVKVVDVDRYNGPSNIVCTIDPAVGRSGGGLFNSGGQLIGVCSCADRDEHEGLYMGRKPIRDLFAKAKLSHLLRVSGTRREPPAFAERRSELTEGARIAELIEEESGAADQSAEAGFAASLRENEVPEFQQSLESDLFPTVTASAEEEPLATPAEITVIVGSDNSSTPKEMIVIKNPSPWLMELLTGRAPAGQQLASARKAEFLSATLPADTTETSAATDSRHADALRSAGLRRSR